MKKRKPKTEIGIIGYIYNYNPEEEAKIFNREVIELMKPKIPKDDEIFQCNIKKGFTRKK